MARKKKARPADGPAPQNITTQGDTPEAQDAPSGKRGLRLPRRFRKGRPGAVPGIASHQLAQMESSAGARVTCIDFGPDCVVVNEVPNVAAFIASHRPQWSAIRWINVDGLSDLTIIRALAEKYRLHPLAVEDVLQIPQRPKVDAYSSEGELQARLFVLMRMMELREGQLYTEQVSLFIGHKTVLTFQERPGDIWDPIRQRIRNPTSRVALLDAGFLAHALIDAIVDQGFPILEHFGDRLEGIEDLVLQNPSVDTLQEIHRMKRELLLLRRTVWPIREVVLRLQREPHECLSDETRVYLRDVYDHVVQIIDMVETYREIATGLAETYMSSMNNRMSEVMKVLTVISTVFIPLTFLAGVYGMNFRHFPEIEWKHGYWAFWGLSGTIAGGMILWFRRRGWL